MHCSFSEGEIRKRLPVLEVTVAGFEMKTCRNDIVTACSGTVSSIQALVYTTREYTEYELCYKKNVL